MEVPHVQLLAFKAVLGIDTQPTDKGREIQFHKEVCMGMA